MSPETLRDLLEKYLQDTISANELPQFLAAARDHHHQAVIKEILAQKLEHPFMYKVADSKKLESMFERMLAKTEDLQQGDLPVRARLARWPRYAAAVVLLAVCGYGAYFYAQRPSKTIPATAAAAIRNVAPGREGAILTLADGKRIVLDSFNNGIIATQDGATLSMKDGRLAYNAGPAGHKAGIYNTISTPRGRQFRVVLEDGTKIWLNAASSIRFPTIFEKKERRVELSGEAYLEVAKNPHQPFKVMAHGAEVRVLGTVFNITAYEDENTIKTTLLEGSIKISFPRAAGGRKELLLKPGEQVKINRVDDAELVKEKTNDLEETIAWKNGLFLMKGADVSVIMRQVARWYDIKVEFEGPVPEGRISGEVPRSMNLQKLLEVMKASGIAISFRWEGDRLIVSR